jgi:hypothetical protein
MGNNIDVQQKKRTTSASSSEYGYPLIEEEGIRGIAIPTVYYS